MERLNGKWLLGDKEMELLARCCFEAEASYEYKDNGMMAKTAGDMGDWILYIMKRNFKNL